jgi:hypothetical protein
MSWEIIFWNPVTQIFGIYLMFFFLLNAYLALWFLYFELFNHFLNNSCDLAILVNTLKIRANAIAIRRNEQI